MIKQGDIKLAVTIFMAIALALLLPCISFAGSLEPTPDAVDTSENPVPTMKTLDQIPPTWSQKLQCDLVETVHGPRRVCPRFEVLADFDNEAVLDKETGLIWEKSPDSTQQRGLFDAYMRCNTLTIGERRGWRLPTVQELASLIDTTQSNPALPIGHPFSGVDAQDDTIGYWSASSFTNYYGVFDGYISSINRNWVVDFAGNGFMYFQHTNDHGNWVWCVRGEHSMDLRVE